VIERDASSIEVNSLASRNVESVRYPVANLEGDLVWAVDLATLGNRPTDLSCVGCAEPVGLRFGELRRPHFAHRPGSTCSGGESALHSTTIRILAEGIVRAAREGRNFPFPITCTFCDVERVGDLARDQGCSAEIDHEVSNRIRPDILIRGSNGSPRYVIEVVVTHAPEDNALAEYLSLQLPVIVVYPSWATLETIRNGLTNLPQHSSGGASVELLGRCPFHRHITAEEGVVQPCGVCTADARLVTVEVSEGQCWSKTCSRRVRVLDVYSRLDDHRVLVAAGSSDLKGVELVARELGVRLQHRWSKAAGTNYNMIMCECGAPSGDNFVYGGLTGEEYKPSLSDALRRYVVCVNGHWEHASTHPWPKDVQARRPSAAAGLIGEAAGLWSSSEEEQLVTFREFQSPKEAAWFMSGLNRR